MKFQDYDIPDSLVAKIEASVNKIGPAVFAKRILIFRLQKDGIVSGPLWDCVSEFQEGIYKSRDFVDRVNKLADDFSKLADGYSSGDERSKIVASSIVSDALALGISIPISELPISICEDMIGADWSVKMMDDAVEFANN